MQDINKIGFLFDLDGVLIDSEKGYSQIWRRVNEEYPTGVDNLEMVIKGCTLDKILADYYPDSIIAEKVTKRLYVLEGKMKYEFKDGAKELLLQLRDRKIPAVLVTSSNDKKMKHLYEEIPEMPDLFDFIITANQISRSKPDPEGYLLGAKKIGSNPVNCIVFEDSLQGVRAGENAGALVVGVAGTLSEEILRPHSDVVVNTLENIDIDCLIKKLPKK